MCYVLKKEVEKSIQAPAAFQLADTVPDLWWPQKAEAASNLTTSKWCLVELLVTK